MLDKGEKDTLPSCTYYILMDFLQTENYICCALELS